MIDTINLLIPLDKIRSFGGAWDLNSKTHQYEKFVRNPTRKELEKYGYMPRITGYKRNGLDKKKNVRIEFSVPKLLFLNNLDEVQQDDFLAVIEALQERLRAMKIIISTNVLESAPVSAVHFSKNIKLEDGYTASYIISELSKVNVMKSLDLARARYINNGESLYFHSSSYELTIYDKIADLRKGSKRAIDKEQTKYQKSLAAYIDDRTNEVLRFEARLGNKQKMKKIFKDIGYDKDISFEEVFNEELSRKVIVSYWERLIKEHSFCLFSLSSAPKSTLRRFLMEDRNMRPKQAIYLIGLITLAKDDGGIRELRNIFSKRLSDRTWYRFVRDLDIIEGILTDNKIRSWVSQIDTKLAEFEPYRHKKVEDNLSTDMDLLCKAL